MATAFLLIAMVTINDHLQSSFYNISVSFGSTTAYNTHIYIYTYNTRTHVRTHTYTHTEESKAFWLPSDGHAYPGNTCALLR